MKKLKLILLSCLTSVLPLSSYAQNSDYTNIIEKDPNSNYIFLFVYRSATYLDWSGASNLAKTTLKSQITRRIKNDASSIGHAQIGWYCNSGNGSINQGATGQTGQNGNEGFELVKSGWGLSVLDTVFTDGYLESMQEVKEKMFKADKNNNFAWLAIKTSNSACEEMIRFVSEYDKSGAAINYGFPVEPLKYEGAGCTSFANAAFVRSTLGLPLSKAWVRHIKLPKKYMGLLSTELKGTKALELAKTPQEEKKIPMNEFLVNNVSWAKDGDEYKDFYYYDPELFYESLVHLENYYRQSAGMKIKNPLRTKDYDEFQTNTKNISEEWMKNLLNTYKRVKIGKIHNTTGLIIEP
ncbi:MAG: hypothetical protein U0354_05460 [Candidatus Sericytochromatia bacterium]